MLLPWPLVFFLSSIVVPGFAPEVHAQQAVLRGVSPFDPNAELEAIVTQLLAVGITIAGGTFLGAGGAIVLSSLSFRLANLTVAGVNEFFDLFEGDPPRTLLGMVHYYSFLQQANQFLFKTLVEIRQTVTNGSSGDLEAEIAQLEKDIKGWDPKDAQTLWRLDTIKRLLENQRGFHARVLEMYRHYIEVLALDIAIAEHRALADMERAAGGVLLDWKTSQMGAYSDDPALFELELQQGIHDNLLYLTAQREWLESQNGQYAAEAEKLKTENQTLASEIEELQKNNPSAVRIQPQVRALLEQYR